MRLREYKYKAKMECENQSRYVGMEELKTFENED